MVKNSVIVLSSTQYAWLYNSPNGNLTVATLYYNSFNTFGYLFLTKQAISHETIPFRLIILIIVTTIIILIYKPENLSKNSRQKLHKATV